MFSTVFKQGLLLGGFRLMIYMVYYKCRVFLGVVNMQGIELIVHMVYSVFSPGFTAGCADQL